jgi:NAD(P)-dependent dehydrogenase (short-subunit alcohol dehydrogenase family)
MTPPRFDPHTLGDLSGRTIVVTGANTGIGFEAARLLGRAGARLLLGCRDPRRAHDAAARLHAESPSAGVEMIALDLADLASVRQAAGAILERAPVLDVLINNAGVMALPRRTTQDGFEMQLGTNHLGHFALTGLLLPALVAAPAARVVTVSSGLHKRGRVDFDDLQGERAYEKWKAYAQSKLCNLLFAYELERRFRASGTRAISLACHPGYASTELQGRGPAMTGSKIVSAIMRAGNALLAQSAEAGAWPTVFAAVSPEARGGDYIGPLGFAKMRGRPGRDRSNRRSHDEADAARLWDVSERLTGVSHDLLRARAAS